MSNQIPIPPQPQPVHLDTSAFASSSASSSSLWDRLSTWASENKAVVYTIAGVTLVVTAAGIYYYTSDASVPKPASKKKPKKRKSKKDDEASTEASTSRDATQSASVTSGDLSLDPEELTEEVIASLSEQVCSPRIAQLSSV